MADNIHGRADTFKNLHEHKSNKLSEMTNRITGEYVKLTPKSFFLKPTMHAF